jgi:hypothetical protein
MVFLECTASGRCVGHRLRRRSPFPSSKAARIGGPIEKLARYLGAGWKIGTMCADGPATQEARCIRRSKRDRPYSDPAKPCDSADICVLQICSRIGFWWTGTRPPDGLLTSAASGLHGAPQVQQTAFSLPTTRQRAAGTASGDALIAALVTWRPERARKQNPHAI